MLAFLAYLVSFITVLILRPQCITQRRHVRRRVQEARHSPCDAILTTFTNIQQRETFERRDLMWPNLDIDQHASVPPSVSVSFAALPAELSALFFRCHVHGVT
jgi:hypothetical protein